MNIHATKTRLAAIGISACVIVAACLWFGINFYSRSKNGHLAISLLSQSQKERFMTLRALAASGDMVGIPANLSNALGLPFQEDLDRHVCESAVIADHQPVVRCFLAEDGYKNEYVLANLSYYVGPGGTRSHSFIFRPDGSCIMHSPDWSAATASEDESSKDAYLLDFTGDGRLEKIIDFVEDPVDGQDNAIDSLRGVLQIWQLMPERAELLLNLRYASWDKSGRSGITPRLYTAGSVYRSAQGMRTPSVNMIDLEMSGQENKQLASIWWDKDKQMFAVDKREGTYWKLLFP